jgi:hypothetical protein
MMKSGPDPTTLTVYDPTGAIEVTQLFAPRLADLHGKTICELSNGKFEYERTFPVIREQLKRQFPTATIIPYTEFPIGNPKIDVDEIGDILRKRGCEAVILGNAA